MQSSNDCPSYRAHWSSKPYNPEERCRCSLGERNARLRMRHKWPHLKSSAAVPSLLILGRGVEIMGLAWDCQNYPFSIPLPGPPSRWALGGVAALTVCRMAYFIPCRAAAKDEGGLDLAKAIAKAIAGGLKMRTLSFKKKSNPLSLLRPHLSPGNKNPRALGA